MPDIYIVEFKGHRRDYFYNTYYHSLANGVPVIVEAERGEDAGWISKKIPDDSNIDTNGKPLSVLRPATDEDLKRTAENKNLEGAALTRCTGLIEKHKLDMKLVESEYQHDRNKLTFYFTADQRVDFRALVRDLAAIYKTRIELRQIGVRDAARRMGGFGICGLVQCCCTHLKKFEPISTQYAREQNLSLNPSKISGNCGRLLCCLTFEKEHYLQELANFPKQGEKYTTDKGEGVVEAINIFERYMLVKHTNGEMEKVTLIEIRKKERHQTSFYKNWRSEKKERQEKKEGRDNSAQ